MKSDQAATIAKTILTHLKDKDQMELLGDVIEALKSTSEYKNSQHRVVVTSASALDSAETKTLKSYLDKKLGTAYSMEQIIDSTLLAGFTLQINDTFIDASILGKINSVSNKLAAKDNL